MSCRRPLRPSSGRRTRLACRIASGCTRTLARRSVGAAGAATSSRCRGSPRTSPRAWATARRTPLGCPSEPCRRQYSRFRTASCKMPLVVKSNATVFPPVLAHQSYVLCRCRVLVVLQRAAVVVAAHPVLSHRNVRRRVPGLARELAAVPLAKIERQPPNPMSSRIHSSHSLQVVPHPVLGVVDVRRGAVVLARARLAAAAELGVVRGDRLLVPAMRPGEQVPASRSRPAPTPRTGG